MADRNYVIEILLKARDDTARAFAAATGQIDAYDAKLDEQRAKSDALAASNGKLSTSYKKLRDDQGNVAQGHQGIIDKQVAYQRAAENAARAETQRRQGDIASQNAAVTARQKLLNAQKDLTKEIDETAASRKKYDVEAGRSAQTEFMAEARNNALLQERTRILGQLEKQTSALSQAQDVRQIDRIAGSIKDLRQEMDNLGVKTEDTDRIFEKAFDTARLEQHRAAMSRNTQELQQYQRLVDQVAQAERKRDVAVQRPGLTDEQKGVIKERLDIDVDLARAHLEEFRLAQKAKGIDIPVRVHEDDIRKARQVADATATKPKSGEPDTSGPGGFLGVIATVGSAVDGLNKSIGDTGGKFQGAFGIGMALMQPLAAAILGLVGTMTALYSAVVAAGGALGGLFATAGAQGIPAMGLLAAAMQRVTSIVGYVQAAHQQLQQQFIAGFQTAHLNALGINQVTNAQHAYQQALLGVQQAQLGAIQAEHSYSNALFAQQQAVRNVGVATFNLNSTRQQATRQLQDLILQENAAKLAAEASSLSVVNAQKALRAAIATGGDVQQAQLGLQQAQLQHVQATVGAQRAISDAAQGSLARQGIAQQVSQAQNAVVEARRAVVDANFSVQSSAQAITSARAAVANAEFGAQQARAAIALAREQAAGYNAGTAAQLAWLRSQMTDTEKSLAGNIQRIYGMFQGVSGRMRPLTDAILRPFVGITSRLIQIFSNPQFMGAFQNLANRMGEAFGSVGKALLSDNSIKTFEGIINAAASNMKPLANIAISFFQGMQSIVTVAAPFVHNFLLWLGQIAQKFSTWASSTRGKNWLKEFFDVGFRSLQAFLSLGMSIARLILAVATAGGGAKTGIGLIQTLQGHIDNVTRSINSHGSAFRTLQTLWASAKAVLSALGTILGAVGHAMMQVGGTPAGRSALKNIADIIAKVLVPGLAQAFILLGRVSGAVLNFIKQHPAVAKFAEEFIAIGLAVGVLHGAFSKILGPLSGVIGLVGKAGNAIAIFKTGGLAGLAEELGPIGPMLLATFGNPVVLAIAAVAAAIAAIVIATGNVGNLIKAIVGPFQTLWQILKPIFDRLGKAVVGLFDALGFHSKSMHDVVKTLIDVFGFLFRAFMAFNPIVRGVIMLFDGLIGAIKLLTNIINTIKQVFTDVFKAVGDIIHGRWAKLPGDFLKIGKDIVKGFWNGIKIMVGTFVGIIKDMVNAVLKFLGISSPSSLFVRIGKEIVNGLWNGVKAIAEFPVKVIGWIASGIGKLLSWVYDLGKKILTWIIKGQIDHAEMIIGIGGKIFDWIWSGIKTIASRFFNIGKSIIKSIVDGIKSAPGALLDALKSLVPGPIKSLISGGAHLLQSLIPHTGGPIGMGYGGGDQIPALLEQGEHVFTKEEVRAAGGHEAIYSLRQSLGGGTRGGPARFALGGQVGGTGTPQGVVGSGQARSIDFQGVHGTLGGDLENIQNFAKAFLNDWKAMWTSISKSTTVGIDDLENQYKKFSDNISNQFTSLSNNLIKIWDTINNGVKSALQTLHDNMARTFTVLDNDVFNAFWYVQHATNQSLKAFNAKPVSVDLGGIPKFSEGGVVGNIGERGTDAILALLGRGEAVLNYAHQKLVDPALRKMYGFGLDGLFKKVRGEHKGEHPGGVRAGAKGLPSFASGGYVSPFPKGTPITWERQDAGLDMVVPPGTPVLAIGDGQITGIDPGWYKGQPLIEQILANGPDKGKYVYYAEGLTSRVSTGQQVKAGQVIGVTTNQPTGLEFGFGGGGTATLRATVAGGGDSAGWWSSTYEQFIRALVAGHSIAVSGNFPAGAGAMATWNAVKEIAVKSKGTLSDLARAAIKKVTDAANKYGESKAGSSSAAGNAFSGTLSGPVPHQVYQFMLANGFNKMAVAGMLGNALQESDMNPNAPGGGLWQQISNFGSGTGGSLLNQMKTMLPQIAGLRGALNAAANPAAAATIFEQQFERPNPALANMARRIAGANQAFAQGFARGGFAGGIPIVAHAGEWLVNKGQQMKIASRIGTTVERLKESLGFTGGPIQYQGGGAPGDQHEHRDPGSASVAEAIWQGWGNWNRAWENWRYEWRNHNQARQRAYTGTVSHTGVYSMPDIITDQYPTDRGAINQYLRAQRITAQRIRGNGKKFTDGIAQFMKNYNLVGGDNGLFALAASAVADFATSQQNIVALAQNGVRVIGQRLRFGRAPTAVGVARIDLQATNRTLAQQRQLQGQEREAYSQITARIQQVQRRPDTAANRKLLQQLIGARNTMLKSLRDADAAIAQSMSDQYDKQVALFQAQNDQMLRGNATITARQVGSITEIASPRGLRASFNNLGNILSKVGPTIATGIAQMAQAIAQTLGNPAELATADAAVVQAAQATHRDLMKQYSDAAARAQHDPRWRKVADDLLSQLETATAAVVQAQAQALSDAINSADIRAQMQQTIIDVFNRVLQAQAGLGNQFGAAQGQILVSRANAANIMANIATNQGLLQTAQEQGNTQQIDALTQKIEDLTAQLQEANLQTQQLITAYRQLSVTMLQAQTQASSGFFSAAAQIAQTLGAISGNLNLPALIQYAKEAGQTLIGEGRQAVQNIRDTMSDTNQPFGAQQGQANNFLNQLVGAFNQGPQAFATELANIAPGLSQFEAGLPQDQLALFQNLVQSLIDNTTAQVNNTQQLQQLNATSNQQQFTSSAWTMFREAIFNGLGGLLPQYALAVPSLDVGGTITRSGLLLGHTGEGIVPANVMRGGSGGSGKSYGDVNVNITSPTEVADPVYLGSKIAWNLEHDPNSR